MRWTSYLIKSNILELVSEYPLWFILLSLLLGAAYAFLLYFRTGNSDLPPWQLKLLSALRFLAVSLIAFLLLAPLVKRIVVTVEKPVIIVGVDNSASLLLTRDSAAYRAPFRTKLDAIVTDLQKKYDVKVYSFGQNVREGFSADYKDKQTDISTFFREIENRYSNRNVGAMIIATDGIYNRGTDPYYAAKELQFPIYAIAMGDTSLRRDVVLRNVHYNKTVFVGDKFPVEAVVEMNKCIGKSTKITLSQGKTPLFSTEVKAGSNRYIKSISFLPDAKSKGVLKYTLQIENVDGEENLRNNRMDFLVEVNDTRQKIAILYDAPHPDLSALQMALSSYARFDVTSFRTDQFNEPKGKYDLLILHQVPSTIKKTDLTSWMSSPVSMLFILGSQTDLNAFNILKTGLIINSARSDFSDALPAYNPVFSRFSVEKDDPAVYNEFPPLLSPYGVYQHGPLTDVLFYQKIGSVTTGTPLVMFFQNPTKKIGIIAGENLWRWRISSFIQKGDHRSFDELFNKMAQYLSIIEDKSFFRLKVRHEFFENESVEMDAEVFNPSYELVNDQDVNVTITDEQKHSYPFVFSKSDRSFFLKAGFFPVGTYSYTAVAMQAKNTYTRNGTFTVFPLNTEAINLVADHNLLKRISLDHNGEMVDPDEMELLVGKINNRDDIHSVSYSHKRLSDLIGTPWLFLLILILLTTEWVLRRRSGI